jgi:hypothetical protein
MKAHQSKPNTNKKNRGKERKCSERKPGFDWRLTLTITVPSILNAILPILLHHFK